MPALTMSGTSDTFYAGLNSTAVNTWVQATDFGTVLDFWNLSIAAGVVVQTSPSSLVDPWSGGTLKQSTGDFYITGGGHYDGNWNGLGLINFETGVSALPVIPTRVTQAQINAMQDSWSASPGGRLEWVNGIYPAQADALTLNTANPPYYNTVVGPTVTNANKGPNVKAIHTYGSFFNYGNKVLVQGYNEYDVVAGTGGPGTIGSDAGGPNVGGSFTLSGDKAYVIGATQYSVTQVNMDVTPTTRVVEFMDYPYVPGKGANVYYSNRTYTQPIGGKLYVVKLDSDGQVAFTPPLVWYQDIPLQSPGRTNNLHDAPTPITPWSAADMLLVQPGTQAFDDVNGVLYIPSQDWSFFLTWKPTTGEMGKVTMANTGPTQRANGAYGRFVFYHNRQCFALVNEFNVKPFFFRAGPSVPTPPAAPVPTPPPAPTPTPTPTPTPPSPPPSGVTMPPWVATGPSWGVVPFTNTIRQALPLYDQSIASDLFGDWPGAAYLDERSEIAQAASGHSGVNLQAVVYSNVNTLTHRAGNYTSRVYAESEFYANTPRPPDIGPENVPYIPHTYCANVNWPARWGTSGGKTRFMMGSYYGNGPGSVTARPYDPFYSCDATVTNGAWSVLNENSGIGWAGIDVSMEKWEAGRGWFLYAHTPYLTHYVFVSSVDGSIDNTSYPSAGDQYCFPKLCMDEGRQLLYVVARGLGDPYMRVLDVVTKINYTVGFNYGPEITAEMKTRPNTQTGWTYLPGFGIVGLMRVDSDPNNLIPVQITLGANPRTDAPTMRAPTLTRSAANGNTFTTIPSQYNGTFGTHVALPDKGISYYNTGPDSLPLYFNWPAVESVGYVPPLPSPAPTPTPTPTPGPTPPPSTPPTPPNTPPSTPPSTPPPSPPPVAMRQIQCVLNSAASLATGVVGQVYAKTTDGKSTPQLFTFGFAGDATGVQTLPASFGNVVTLYINVPSSITVTIGQIVSVSLGNSSFGTALFNGTVI